MTSNIPHGVHSLRLGDHVFQRVNPWHAGVITALEKGVSFTVTYDRPPGETGKKREPKERYIYPWSRTGDFLVGKGESEANPFPVNIEEIA